jgi:hypothetical protein
MILGFCGLCSTAMANPNLGGPMSHVLVSVYQQAVYLTLESPDMDTVVMQDGHGFTGPASILNGSGYNAQFGWLSNGFIALPPGAGMFVRTVGGSPWVDVYSQWGFDPVLGTRGSDPVWQWNGTMVHNWYATRVHGEHTVTHEVFVGDQFGRPLDGWTSGTIDLRFLYGPGKSTFPTEPGSLRPGPTTGATPVPPPAGMFLLGGRMLFGLRRRKP